MLVSVLGMLLLVATAFAASTDNDPQTNDIVIEEIATLGIEDGSPQMTVTTPATPGDLPPQQTVSATYLQYTTNVEGTKTRALKAALASDTATEYSLFLTAGAPNGSGTGTKGTSAGELDMSTSNDDALTGIESCNTGAVSGDGSEITYRLECTAVPKYDADVTHTITFTLDDDA